MSSPRAENNKIVDSAASKSHEKRKLRRQKRQLRLRSDDAENFAKSFKLPINSWEGFRHFFPLDQCKQGNFGKVFKSTYLLTSCTLAVKKIPAAQVEEYESALNEATILSTLRHPNIVKLDGVIFDGLASISLVTPWASGTLFEIVPDKKVRFGIRLDMAIQLCGALTYLTEQRVTHGDIKPQNILVLEQFRIRLADFGGSYRDENRPSLSCGTLLYAAPERMDGRSYGTLSDMYSFGIVLYEMVIKDFAIKGFFDQMLAAKLCGKSKSKPVEDEEKSLPLAEQILNQIYTDPKRKNEKMYSQIYASIKSKVELLEGKKKYPREVTSLIMKCLDVKPANRPTADEALKTLEKAAHEYRQGTWQAKMQRATSKVFSRLASKTTENMTEVPGQKQKERHYRK